MRLVALTLAAGLALSGAQADTPLPVRDTDFMPVDPALAALGQLLFYDPVLSGNRNVSCATCHHPRFGTSDGLSLGLGDGGIGLGPERRADPGNPPEQRIPRNAPALFNLGAKEFTVLFHDGRIEVDPSRPSGLRTPLGEEMVAGFDSLLSAQTMFPVLSPDEMAGHYGENEVSTAVRQGRLTGKGGAWDIIAERVRAIPEYKAGFEAADPAIESGRDLDFTDISDAIAAFMAFEWRSTDSPFDAYLAGEGGLAPKAEKGLELFYGPAGCSECHSGPFQTDHRFHAMGQPQIGPGKAERFESHFKDTGRMRVTGREADAYRFRTPSLRNVLHTGPWGHAGAYDDLEAFLRHHVDPVTGLERYEAQAVLPPLEAATDDFAPLKSERAAIATAVSRPPVALRQGDISALVAFLGALSDPVALGGRLGIPETVPSGLPVER